MKTLLICTALVGALNPSAVLPQKRTVTTTIHLENRSRAQSLDDLWSASTLVVEGTIEAAAPVDVPTSSKVLEYTEFAFRVIEVFKGDGRVAVAGAVLPVRQRGGTRDRGDYVEKIVPDGMPLLDVGGRYVLFLRAHILPTAVFYSTGSLGPEGVFGVRPGGVETPGRTLASQRLAKQDVTGLRQALRQKGGGRD